MKLNALSSSSILFHSGDRHACICAVRNLRTILSSTTLESCQLCLPCQRSSFFFLSGSRAGTYFLCSSAPRALNSTQVAVCFFCLYPPPSLSNLRVSSKTHLSDHSQFPSPLMGFLCPQEALNTWSLDHPRAQPHFSFGSRVLLLELALLPPTHLGNSYPFPCLSPLKIGHRSYLVPHSGREYFFF